MPGGTAAPGAKEAPPNTPKKGRPGLSEEACERLGQSRGLRFDGTLDGIALALHHEAASTVPLKWRCSVCEKEDFVVSYAHLKANQGTKKLYIHIKECRDASAAELLDDEGSEGEGEGHVERRHHRDSPKQKRRRKEADRLQALRKVPWLSCTVSSSFSVGGVGGK